MEITSIRGLNEVFILGVVCDNPNVRLTGNGILVAKLTLAVTESLPKGETFVDRTLYVPVSAWAGRAEFVERNIRKGSLCHVRGALHVASWKKVDGGVQKLFEVVAKEFLVLGREPEQLNRHTAARPEAD